MAAVDQILSLISLFLIVSCSDSQTIRKITPEYLKNGVVVCSDADCSGTYKGSEFVGHSDVAHQFSNTMCSKVGDHLKSLFDRELYSVVNFDKIEMTTLGLGTRTVQYFLRIPFDRVDSRCQAYTSFDHVGGWNHSPELAKRQEQLKSVLLPNDALGISTLKTTVEGLQEYWIQWRNQEKQKNCRGSEIR